MEVGCLLSTAATLRPALSMAVAKERVMRWTVRVVDALAASMKELFKQILLQLKGRRGFGFGRVRELISESLGPGFLRVHSCGVC